MDNTAAPHVLDEPAIRACCPGWFLDDLRRVTPEQLEKIRGLDDFFLTLFVSELHDGWSVAAETLKLMRGPIDYRGRASHSCRHCDTGEMVPTRAARPDPASPRMSGGHK
jgi:hypothetical protein